MTFIFPSPYPHLIQSPFHLVCNFWLQGMVCPLSGRNLQDMSTNDYPRTSTALWNFWDPQHPNNWNLSKCKKTPLECSVRCSYWLTGRGTLVQIPSHVGLKTHNIRRPHLSCSTNIHPLNNNSIQHAQHCRIMSWKHQGKIKHKDISWYFPSTNLILLSSTTDISNWEKPLRVFSITWNLKNELLEEIPFWESSFSASRP